MKKDSFVLYLSQYDAIRDFSLRHKGELFDALFSYVRDCRVPVFNSKEVLIAFRFFRVQIDMDRAKYEDICEKRSAAGRLGGAKQGNKNANKHKESKQANARFEKQNKPNDNDINTCINTSDNNKEDKSSKKNKKEKNAHARSSSDEHVFFDEAKQIEYAEHEEKWIKHVFDLWNGELDRSGSKMRRVRVVTRSRLNLLNEIWKTYSPEEIAKGFRHAARSAYLNGCTKERSRPADFDWIIKKENFVKCIEGGI